MKKPSLTVLICTHNRAELLMSTLHHLNAARRPKDWQIKVLVMLNACSDSSKKRIKQLVETTTDELPIVWHEEPIPGKSNALNSAISLIEADLVAFVDDDQRVGSDYLVNVCQIAGEHPETGLFCGRILPDWDGSEPAWIHDTGPYRIYPLPIPQQTWGEVSHPLSLTDTLPGGGNLFVRRRVFDRIRGFSTRLGPHGHNLGGGEDTDFVLRALKANEQLVYTPDVIQYHLVSLNRFRLGYLLRKSFHRSRAAIQMRSSHTEVPLYMWRKLAEYIFHAVFSVQWAKTRFYFVRTAAVLGEISGARSCHRKG